MTATNGKPTGSAGPGQSRSGKVVFFLGSLRLAIFVLSFIAVSSIVGTLIKQQAPPEEYLSRFSQSTYAVIHAVGFDDVFHSWWFLLSILILGINLATCTFRRLAFLFGSQATETVPKESSLTASDLHFHRKGMGVEEVARLLRGYQTVSLTPQGAVLEKGWIAKYGVLVIHGSILLILLGSLIGLHYGYRGSVTLSVGESKDVITTRGTQEKQVPLGFTVRCADFKVTFYENGQPKEYMSSLEVLEGSRVVVRKDIRVNDPLTYKGISFYQATYGENPVSQFTIGGKSVELNDGSTFHDGELLLMVVRHEGSVHHFGPGVQVAYLDKGEPKAVWFLRDVPRLREQVILGVPMKLEALKQERYTGLEVTRDPGIGFVWCGFFLMLCGLYANFGIYHRRLYLLQTDRGVLVAGTSRKNKEGFRREFQRLKERLNGE